MPVLTEEQVGNLWLKHGGPKDAVYFAIAVANHESHRDTNAVNSQSGATGLMQIHPGGPSYKNPDRNMQAAVGKYKARKWQPWSVCGSGAWSAGNPDCPNLAGEAKQIEARLTGKLTGAGLTDASLLDKIPGVGAAGDAIDGAKAIGAFFVELARKIGDPQTWLDLAKILGGFVLLFMGAKRIMEVSV